MGEMRLQRKSSGHDGFNQVQYLVMEVLQKCYAVYVLLHVAALVLSHLHVASPRRVEDPCLIETLLPQSCYLCQDHSLWRISARSHRNG